MGIIIVFMIITGFINYNNTNEDRNTEKRKQESYLQNEGITVSNEYQYKSFLNDIFIRFIIDGEAKKILISQTSAVFETIPYSEIIGCAIMADSKVTGGVGRAIVGGMIAGDVGAIVGAATAKPHIMSYKIVIYKNSVIAPTYEIPLIKTKVSEKDKDYINAVEFANNVTSIIKAVLWINQH